MQNLGVNPSRYGLENHGIKDALLVRWNLGSAALIEAALSHREGLLAARGALVVRTGRHTGRSPRDKFVVRTPDIEDKIWWGSVNQPMPEDRFDALYRRVLAYLQDKRLYVQDCYAGADERFRIPIRVISQHAWHNLFARQLFVRPDWTRTGDHVPQFVIIGAPDFHADPDIDGTRSEAFIIVHFGRRIILIGGTEYAGEMKKSIFTIMNYLLPEQGVLSMHCAANMGHGGDVALFFGLSGTGKTTLSADPNRRLIGDDEHGWSDDGVFNFEGGCYAKCIHLSREAEPQIWNAIRFGSVLENVSINLETRLLDFDDDSLTENTRVAYPLTFIDNAVVPSVAGHPDNVFFLTADAFGVLPPISRLTGEQARYHFLSGYTAKVAGTEAGVKEPEATFSTCFGAPFLPRHPTVYSRLLGDKLDRHAARAWLVNTGWTGGPYGVGRRMSIQHTRALITAALTGALSDVPTDPDPIFGVLVPRECPGVPREVLTPRDTWNDRDAYDRAARQLASLFVRNFEQFAEHALPETAAAGPRVE
ncbi:MAG: phosphoenolpyruvate carboxykinase (ATP) [Chthonomonadales bacterium]|nr:phosphoenolpyruvate carboxykinase (ATP) [Chthonomonadales bacterium]